jgi:mono/diheme cytochrome c family protein
MLIAGVVLGAIAAIAGVYFAFMPRDAVTAADPRNAGLVTEGDRVYRANCASCHGVRLEGQAGWNTRRNADGTLPAPPHDKTGHTWHHPDQVLFDYTKKGGQAFAPQGFKSAMPAFAGALSDREIWAVLSYIKSQWPADIRERQRQISERNR